MTTDEMYSLEISGEVLAAVSEFEGDDEPVVVVDFQGMTRDEKPRPDSDAR